MNPFHSSDKHSQLKPAQNTCPDQENLSQAGPRHHGKSILGALRQRVRRFLWVFLAGGLLAGATAAGDSYFELSKNLEIFATLYREVNTYYVDDIDPAKFMRTGIDAMLKSLDPYTNYIPESEIESFRLMTTGQYGGIGALISKKDDYVVIADPYEGMPAQRADIRAGDILLEVDGQSVKGRNTDDVSKLLKGQAKTEVTVRIRREGENKPLEKKVMREEIKISSVSYSGMLDKNTGYINLSGFRTGAGEEVKKALQDLKKEGMTQLVFDMRGNPGGSLDEAVRISGMFISRGSLVVRTKGKVKEWEKDYISYYNPEDTTTPIVVLIDGASASASEIVSGTLQDYDRGVVVGQKSFGKGLVQTVKNLNYNTQVKVTTAKYYIPSGRCIQAVDYVGKDSLDRPVKTPESSRVAFKTRNGRVVYDAGGVSPDVFVEPSMVSNITAVLIGKRHIFDFATLYRSRHEQLPASPDEFEVSDALFAEFMTYLRDKDYTYTTESEKALEDFKEKAIKEQYFAQVESHFDALMVEKKKSKEQDMQRHKEEIKYFLAQELVSRYHFQKGRLRSAFRMDEELVEARKILSVKVRYEQLLRP
ncbi:MAG: S41 family peptidase [Sphingomonadales bacterium]|nr:S41 family peptidase [Sphingomonadales bacterium]